MANDGQGGCRRCKLGWLVAGLLLVLPFLVLFSQALSSPDENIVLSRNEVVNTPTGRLWRGTYWNHSDSLYTDLDAVILFLDRDGRPVGQALGGAARLEPGEVFHFQAALPPSAVRMRMYQLRWTTGGHRAVLGPFLPWEFGYVQETRCREILLAIGSCTPARERGG